jgi:alkanesulfonate monooxygenase SsuD/methylene tetrahydromethanopterin reductase-like flavin-dependent oxidoreductase (luciferase family)
MTDAATPEEFRHRWERIRAYAAEYGRQATALGSCIHLMVNVNADAGPAFEEARTFLLKYYGEDFGRAYLDVWVASGAPEAVAARIREYLDAGCTVPILRFASWEQEKQLDRFVEHVVPLLRDRIAIA